MTDLGVLPDGSDASLSLGINDSGVVVGTSYVWGGSTPHRATIWDRVNGLADLNSMVDSSGDGWILAAGGDINNAGQIVGWGYHDGQERGFLLTPNRPVPEPSSLAMFLGLGGMGLIAAWRRRRAALA